MNDYYFKIHNALDAKLDKVDSDKNNDKTIEITFKKTGNTWIIKYHLAWCGTRYGFKRHCTAQNGNIIKHFRDLEKLASAIAAGYIS